MQDADEALARRLAEELNGPTTMRIGETSAQGARAYARATLRVNGASPAKLSDPKEDLKAALDLLRGKLTCGECEEEHQRTQGKVSFNNTSDARSAILRLCHTTCRNCYTLICSGCGQASECPSDCESEHSHGCETAQHCPSVRVVLLYEALAALDRLYTELKTPLSSDAPKSKKPRASGSGVGYGKGYGESIAKPGDKEEAEEAEVQASTTTATTSKEAANDGTSQSFHMKVDTKVDKLILIALQVVGHLLPRPQDDDAEAYDYVPEPAMRPLVQLSTLPDTLSELLRNDSITSISERLSLYHAVIKILHDLALSQPTMTPVLTEPRRVKATLDGGIGPYVTGNGGIQWETEHGRGRGTDLVYVDPLYKQLARLVRHAKTYVRIADARSDVKMNGATPLPSLIPLDIEAEKQAKEALELAKHIISVFEAIDEAVKESGGGMPMTAGLSPEEGRSRSPAFEQQTYDNMCERLAFDIVDVIPSGIRALASGQIAQMSPANANHLNKEIATLATSLPSGVFLRIDESSRNEMRALIAGPDDTPYAFGLYEFSIKLPWDYPARSPTVKILTTGAGRVRFNPNLYAEGKVCLSLLGTWAGAPSEMWQAWKSTLLQVLISIQSMIMNDTPYHNEPGMRGGQREIVDYNKNVQLQSVRWAMIEWMDDAHLSGIWGSVIREHFTLRRANIRCKIAKWAADDSRFTQWDVRTMPCCGSQPPQLGGGSTGAGSMDLVAEFEKRCDKIAPPL